MTLTFSNLQDKVLGWLDLGDHTTASPKMLGQVKEALNEANIERATSQRWPFMLKDSSSGLPSLTLTPGQRYYTLASDFANPLYFRNSSRNTPLTQYDNEYLPNRDYTGNGLIDDYYVSTPQYGGFHLRGAQGQQFVLTWTPTAADTILYEYYVLPTEMSGDSDVPNIPYPFSRILIYDALIELTTYDENLNSSNLGVWQKRQQGLEDRLWQAYGQNNNTETAKDYQDWTPRE